MKCSSQGTGLRPSCLRVITLDDGHARTLSRLVYCCVAKMHMVFEARRNMGLHFNA